MDSYSSVEIACMLMVVIPGVVIIVGIWAYGLYKYGGRKNDDWMDECP